MHGCKMEKLREKRNARYRKRIQKKPKFIKIFIIRFMIVVVVFMVIAAGGTFSFKHHYKSSVDYAFDYVCEEALNRLPEQECNYDEEDIDFFYNRIRYIASNIAGNAGPHLYTNGKQNPETILRKLFYDTGMTWIEIQLYDENGSMIFHTGDCAFTTVRYLSGNGESYGRVYVCEDICEKYGADIWYDFDAIDTSKIYIKGAKYEPCIKGVTDEERLIKEGYQCISSKDENVDSLGFGFSAWGLDYGDRMKEMTEKYTDEQNFDVILGGKKMTMKVVEYYHLWYDYGKAFVIIYISLFVLTVIIALIVSYMTYISREVQYETDLYRRNITNTMAHNLKSPLMIISGYVQNILADTKPEKNPYYLEKVQSTIEDMDRLITDMLNLSKSEDMYKKENIETVDMRKLIMECVKKYARILEETGDKIIVNGECEIKCDRIWMEQIIDNIMSNAVKYRTADSEIMVELKEDRITFKNKFDGTIDVEPQKLLNPFVRGDNSRQGQKENGIGLSIVHNIVRAYGYKISINIIGDEFNISISNFSHISRKGK